MFSQDTVPAKKSGRQKIGLIKSKETLVIREIAFEDKEYPKRLKDIHSPPKTLYVNGEILLQDDIAVALVGSRRATNYGLQTCERLAFELASVGVMVVSGMARGIDTSAHRGALKAHGRTIAVMGSGHDHIYPPENKKLYREISESGAVITEFPDDMPPLGQNFPRRNRIISGLSLGVVVVEATKDSGALITANFALEQGREVFAVPGKIDSATSCGTHELIKDGARLVQSAEDIMEELNISLRPRDATISREQGGGSGQKSKASLRLTDEEKKVLNVLSDEPMNIDDISERMGFSPRAASKVLLGLELRKLVTRMPGENYIVKEK